MNAERAKGGLRPYICDVHLRFVAEKHLENADIAMARNIDTATGGNGHDWWVGRGQLYGPCRYSSANRECMWDKPYVS